MTFLEIPPNGSCRGIPLTILSLCYFQEKDFLSHVQLPLLRLENGTLQFFLLFFLFVFLLDHENVIKMKKLLEVLSSTGQRSSLEVLLRCEAVLEKMDLKGMVIFTRKIIFSHFFGTKKTVDQVSISKMCKLWRTYFEKLLFITQVCESNSYLHTKWSISIWVTLRPRDLQSRFHFVIARVECLYFWL